MVEKYKILLVDDEPTNLQMYSFIFKEAGYSVSTASNITQALKILDTDPPDLMLVDIILHNESGLDLLKQVKADKRFSHIYVVMISGMRKSSHDQAYGLELGADGYIIRPIEKRELLARIEAFFRHKKTLDELRKSEAKLKKIIDKNPDAILVVDNDGVIRFANPAAGKMFQLTIDELLSRIFGFPIINGENTEINIVRYDNQNTFGEMRSIDIEWDGINSMLTSIRDVSERKIRENEIRILNTDLEKRVSQKTDQLRYSLQEMEAFTYSVSHDLRAPLRAIMGFAEIIKEDYLNQLPAAVKTLLDDIIRNSKSMGNLIDDLLEFSRLGRKDFSKSEIDIKSLFVHNFTELKNLYKRDNIKFTIGELPRAFGDYNLLNQVVANLLSNAFKFTSKKEIPEITVQGKTENNYSIYSIKDNGVGFDMKYYHKLFNVFSRLHKTEDFEGTGVGLAIVHRIIIKHAGKIWAESELNKGTTFHFALPNSQ